MSRQHLTLGGAILAVLVLNALFLFSRSWGVRDPYKQNEEGRPIRGTLTLIDPLGYISDGTRCEGEGPYADLEEGAPVLVRDSAGSVVARTRLGEGVRRGPQGAGQATLIVGCTFEFSIDVVPTGNSYAVFIGGRQSGGTYSLDELADQAGKVSLSLGCGSSSTPSDRIEIEPPSRVYLTREDRESRGSC